MKVEVINYEWQSAGIELLVECKINNSFRRMKVSRKDMRVFFLSKCKHLGINDSNVEDMMNDEDVKYTLKEEFLQKFMFDFFKV